MSKVLLTRIGCRYTCNFCHPQTPYENTEYSRESNRAALLAEIDATPGDCRVFVIGGIDCMEDLDLLHEVCRYIRQHRGDGPEIHVQSHCAEYANPDIVAQSAAIGVSRILVPVYGPTPAIHHRVMTPKDGTSVAGFPQLRAIENCLAAGIGVTAHTVVARGNAEHLTETIDTVFAIAEERDTAIDFRIRPVFLTRGQTEHYIPVKELSPVLNEAHAHLIRINEHALRVDYRFEGFPLCLFRRFELRLQNAEFTSTLKQQYALFVGRQLPTSPRHYSGVDPRIPNYRIRVHAPICEPCLFVPYCAGFQQLDFETYGVGDLRPIV